jgi:hypothetical protein
MKLNGQQIGIGLLAGIAAALLSVGLATGSALGFAAYFLSPFPIMAAGLGWGFASALSGAAVAAAFAGLVVSSSFAAVLFANTLFPALTAVWYLALARPAEEIGGQAGKLAWFPLADTILRTAGAVATGFIAIGAMVGYGPDFISANVGVLIERMRAIDPQFQPAAGLEESMTRVIGAVLPYFQTGFWTLVIVANLYLAARLARLSDRFARPADDWPATLRLPQTGLIVFGVALALSLLLPGGFGHTAGAAAGAVGAAFAMAGFARLHALVRGSAMRPIILMAGYLAALLFLPILFAFLIGGLLQTGRHVPVSENIRKRPSSTTN